MTAPRGRAAARLDPRDRNLPSEQRFLVAALEALGSQGLEVLTDGLTRKRLTALTGQSRQTLHRTHPDPAALVRQLVAWCAAPGVLGPRPDDLANHVEGLLGAEGLHLEAVHRLADAQARTTFASHHFATGLALLLLAASDGPSAPVVRQRVQQVDQELAGAAAAALARWDLELRRPFDTVRLAQLVAAVHDGVAVRATFDPGLDSVGLFSDAATVLVEALVAPRGTSSSVGDGRRGSVVRRRPTPAPERTRRAVVGAATRLLADGAPLTSAELEEATGLPAEAIDAHFGGVDGVMAAAVAELVPLLTEGVEADRAAQPAPRPLALLERHLERMAGLALANHATTRPYALVALDPSRPATPPSWPPTW